MFYSDNLRLSELVVGFFKIGNHFFVMYGTLQTNCVESSIDNFFVRK